MELNEVVHVPRGGSCSCGWKAPAGDRDLRAAQARAHAAGWLRLDVALRGLAVAS